MLLTILYLLTERPMRTQEYLEYLGPWLGPKLLAISLRLGRFGLCLGPLPQAMGTGPSQSPGLRPKVILTAIYATYLLYYTILYYTILYYTYLLTYLLMGYAHMP